MSKFLGYIKSLNSLNAILAKGALIAPPAFAGFSKLAPPWPENSELIVGFVISVFQLGAAALIFTSKPSAKTVNAWLKVTLPLAFLFLIGYCLVFSFLTYETQDGQIYVVGFFFRQAHYANYSVEYLLKSAEFIPSNIWLPWTVVVSRVSILVAWILFYMSISSFFSFFSIKNNP